MRAITIIAILKITNHFVILLIDQNDSLCIVIIIVEIHNWEYYISNDQVCKFTRSCVRIWYSIYVCTCISYAEKKVLSDNEWTGWLRWGKSAFEQGMIKDLWKTNIDMEKWFDPDFQNFVEKELIPRVWTHQDCNRIILFSAYIIIFCTNGVSGFCPVPRSTIAVKGKGQKTELAEKSPLPYRRLANNCYRLLLLLHSEIQNRHWQVRSQ